MKIYLAGEGFRDDIQNVVRRRLYSYWYHRRGDRPSVEMLAGHEKFHYDMFLDSGAFTASTQDVVIKVDEYAKFLHNTQHMFTTCSSLDDIKKNEQVSWDNLKALESLGCKIQPVFHTAEDPAWLVKYLDEYDYIFIGGMVNRSTKWLKGWLDDLFDRYLTNRDGTPKVKLHGFGLTDQILMFRYPWHSVDSTSWMFTGMYGACSFMTPRGLRKVVFSKHNSFFKHLNAPHYCNMSSLHQREIDKWLEPHGVTAEQCIESHNFRNLVNARTFGDMEVLGTDRFVKRERGFFDA